MAGIRITYQWTHGHFTHIAMNTLVTVFAGIPLEGARAVAGKELAYCSGVGCCNKADPASSKPRKGGFGLSSRVALGAVIV